MRLRTFFLACPACLAFVYPLLMGQKGSIVAALPFLKGIANWGCFWIAEPLLLTLCFFGLSFVIRQKICKYLGIIAASLCLSFAVAEMHFAFKEVYAPSPLSGGLDSSKSTYVQSGQATHLFENDSHLPDPVIGYGPNPKAARVAARRVQGDKVIYDVLYSRDEEGRRITPDRGDKADTAVLIFGCSFAVGEGLRDQEAFPWRLGEMLGEKFQVFNYGFHGYGSHHMLGLVESGRLDALLGRYKHVYAFYLTITDHPPRCLGYRLFHRGPRYVLENGELKYVGMFTHTLDRLFAHSLAYAEIRRAYYRRLISERGLNTHAAIITKAMHALAARYHAHAVTVIYPDFTSIEPMLKAKGVHTLPLTEAMPDFASASGKYGIPGDGHPSALANARIAEALSEYVRKNAQAAGAAQ